ncbi:MAG: hypothetical protein JNK02_00420 [Planctomycetes bacterium]|nr:hypothetical protein [Planctomycetota bacterium]
MKWNTILLAAGLVGLGVLGATQGLRAGGPETQTTYWASGTLRSEFELRDGVPHGHGARWHRDGTPEARGTYVDGRMEGRWEFWLPGGALDPERTGTYRAGVRIADADGSG